MIELSDIKNEINKSNLETARRTFAPGAKITANGKISKTTTKENDLVCIIESEMKVFASMASADFVFHPKFKKGEQVKIEGKLQSLGFNAVCLNGCRITKI